MTTVVRVVTLRPVAGEDLPQLLQLLSDPDAAGEFQWFGHRTDRAREVERRWHEDGLFGAEQSWLAVTADDELAGWVTWLPVPRTSAAIEIGIALFPEHRGHGVGTDAQRQLVSYLFSTSIVHRLQAGTEVDNLAEQRSLEKIGFRREGVLRGVTFRAGQWRDSAVYGITRDDL
jgi:RimJ/RimL family protein N-acetyltransferase